jgi:Pectate lyase superfamily protein
MAELARSRARAGRDTASLDINADTTGKSSPSTGDLATMAFPKITRRGIFTLLSGSSIPNALATTKLTHHMSTPTGILFYDPQVQMFSAISQQHAGAYYLFFLTGTLTVAHVYTDGLLTTRLPQVPGAAQPSCTADSAGHFNPIYLNPRTIYRVQLFTAGGVKLKDTDPYVPPAPYVPTQADIGALLYPQTSAEIAAGSTPVNVWLAPGNVLRYGTNTNPGTTDMTAAIQAALNQSTNAGVGAAPVYLPTNTYRISAAITAITPVPLHIYGDGQEMSVIHQHTDAHVFNITASTASNGRLVLHDLSFVAIVGTAMRTGAAIKYSGQNSVPSPVRTLDIRRVTFQGSATTDEFKYGIYMTSANQPTVDTTIFNGVVGSSNSEHIHFESNAPYSIGANFNNVFTYSANIGFNIVNSSKTGIENVSIMGGEHVGVIIGIIARNTIGLSYTEPKITIDNVHVNSSSYCVFIDLFIQVVITKCVFYRFGAMNNSAFVQLAGVQQFDIDLITQISDSTDCPVVMLDGSANLVAHGIVDGVFSGKGGSGFPVVHAVATSTLADIIVRGVIRFGYTHWLPSLSALPYTPGGSIQLNASTILATDKDNINPSITPTGATPNLKLDLSYVQCGLATINLAAGTISTILGNRPGQRITLSCTNAGVVLAHNASQVMPGSANFTFAAGQTIDLYRLTSSWLAVSRQ